jgi:hypothetical protein
MRGIGRALVGLEGIGVPHWVVAVLFFGTIILFLAYVLRQAPLGRARGLITRSVHAAPEQRAAMENEALEIVWDLPVGLLIVGQEALKWERRALAERVLARLKETGQRPAEIRSLEDALYGRQRPRLEAECVAIRGFIEEGLHALAIPRLNRAHELWPTEEALDELDAQLARSLHASEEGPHPEDAIRHPPRR